MGRLPVAVFVGPLDPRESEIEACKRRASLLVGGGKARRIIALAGLCRRWRNGKGGPYKEPP